MGYSVPSLIEKWPFLPKNGLKMPISGKKTVFLGSGCQHKPPLPYFADA